MTIATSLSASRTTRALGHGPASTATVTAHMTRKNVAIHGDPAPKERSVPIWSVRPFRLGTLGERARGTRTNSSTPWPAHLRRTRAGLGFARVARHSLREVVVTSIDVRPRERREGARPAHRVRILETKEIF